MGSYVCGHVDCLSGRVGVIPEPARAREREGGREEGREGEQKLPYHTCLRELGVNF